MSIKGRKFFEMTQNSIKMTISQFAKLHKVNKRTLHYYDEIGLFSPSSKGEKGYRYYDISQSIVFEYIRMLKEMNMSIDEIKSYCKNANGESFLKIASKKEREIDLEIRKLENTKKILNRKKEQVEICENLTEEEIRIEELREEKISILPYNLIEGGVHEIFDYLKDKWSIEQIRMGIGSFISVNKLKNKEFEKYDGIYSYTLEGSSNSKTIIREKGKYLCAYQKGSWDKASVMYEKLLKYVKENRLELKGYAYEIGLNEFAISKPEEYVTKFMIKIEE